ncbi:MAG: uracil-DNA glycosylase family protein [Gammaproteobacteria bacterium]
MSQKLAYLNAMGIDVWVRRDTNPDHFDASNQVEFDQIVEVTPKQSTEIQSSDAVIETISIETDESLPHDKSSEVHSSEPQEANEINSDTWEVLQNRVASCIKCDLHTTRTQVVFGVGNQNADWLIIGEAPGAEEDRQGEPFVGRAGQLLNSMLVAVGLSRDQVFIANILKCRPPENRDPRPEEVVSCSAYLQRQIELIKPKIILCVGRIAAQNLLKLDTPIGKMRGKKYIYEPQNIPVVVTYHPAYLLRSPTQKYKSWEDLLLAKSLMEET